VPPLAQTLFQESVHETLMDAVHVAEFTHDRERGFALQLPGVAQGYIGFLTLAASCSAPVLFEPFCEANAPPGEPLEDFWRTRSRCSRLGCEGPGVDFIDVYFTVQPRTAPDDRHPFSYETTSPSGTAVFDPNPFITYRIDSRDPERVAITADLSRTLHFTPRGRQALDLRQSGDVSVVKSSGEITSAELDLRFPGLATEAGLVAVEVALGPDATGLGSVMLGATRLARISGTFSFDTPLVFSWKGGCAD
jgi:hypothetical protein